MEVSDAFKSLGKALSRIFSRYHFIMFTVLALGGLAITTFMLYQILTTPSEEPTASTSTVFDTKTMKKIDNLSLSNSPTVAPQDSSKRTNPF